MFSAILSNYGVLSFINNAGDVMKKIFVILCTAALAFALTACKSESSNVVTVNAAQVFQESESGKQAKEYLEQLATEMQNDLQKFQEEYDQAAPADKADVQKKLQATVIDYQQKMRSEEQQILNNLTETYQSVLDEYRTANGVTVILRSEVIASAAPEADITSKIIEAMNKKAASVTSAAKEAPKAADEAPASANATGNATAN